MIFEINSGLCQNCVKKEKLKSRFDGKLIN